MKKSIYPNTLFEFLIESNSIEGVYDGDSFLQALYAWDWLIAKDELTIHNILRAHKILMAHQPLRPSERGYFRRCQVYIGFRESPDWHHVPMLMEQWCDNAMKTVLAGDDYFENDHVAFEKIHPFVDGNGRIGRILMNWQRVKCGLPILVIKHKERGLYYEWFNRV